MSGTAAKSAASISTIGPAAFCASAFHTRSTATSTSGACVANAARSARGVKQNIPEFQTKRPEAT